MKIKLFTLLLAIWAGFGTLFAQEPLNVVTCDSYYWPESDETYTCTGTYQHGNSILNVVIFKSSYTDTTITSCGPYYWTEADTTIHSSGTYVHVFADQHGCDSTVTLHITITQKNCDSIPSDEIDEEPEDYSEYEWIDVIDFYETPPPPYDGGPVYSGNEYFSFVYEDTTNTLIKIQEGTCKFGTPEDYDVIPYALQMKPGAALKFSCPVDGVLRIAPHMMHKSSDEVCTLIVEQNGETLLSKVVSESDKNGSVYPYVYVNVQKGEARVSVAGGGITFHSFAFGVPKEASHTSLSGFWNFSDDIFDALGDTISETKTIDGLTVHATENKRCYTKTTTRTIEGLTFSRYLYLGNKGTENYHSLSFSVSGSCMIDVYVSPSGLDGADRTLYADCGTFGNRSDSVVFNGMVRKTLHYTGDATTIYLYSADASINIFAIRVVPVESALPFYWNFSDDYLVGLDTIKTDTILNGMTFRATNSKRMVVASNKQSIESFKFTHALKMGGTGAETSRNISFGINGPCKIDVYLRSASSSDDRVLRVDAGSFGGTQLGLIPALATGVTKSTIDYTGDPTTIYMYSTNSAINIYAIRVRYPYYSILFKDSGETGNIDQSGDDAFSTNNFIASTDIPIFAINSHKVSNARMGCGIKLGTLQQDQTGFIEGYATLHLSKSVATEAIIFAVAGYKVEETSIRVQNELVTDLTPRTFSQHIVSMNGQNVRELDIRSSETLGRAYVYGITIIPSGSEMPVLDTIQAVPSDENLGQVSGGGVFVHGNVVTLLAEEKEGAHFVGWSDEVTQNPRTFAASENKVITAVFEQNEMDGLYTKQSDVITPNKILRDGQIYILRGEKVYTLQGQEVR